MKKNIVAFIILLFVFMQTIAQEPIATARTKVDQIITVGGIVTNGLELGGIRYFQDGTGGLAAYGYTALLNVVPGDSIIVTGKLVAYNNLLEISPLNSVTVISSGNPVPSPAVITIDQIGEPYEAQLVKIKNVLFENAGSLFEGNKNYNFTADGQTGLIRINKDSESIIGQIIPSGSVDLVTICSQYSYNANDVTTGYQLLPRTMADFIVEGSIHFTSPVSVSNITKNSLTISWNTNEKGTCEMIYGIKASDLNLKANGTVTALGSEFLNKIELTGLNPGSIVFGNGYSYNATDTVKTTVKPYATESNSSGNMKVYFNSAVDVSYSKGVDAIFLNNAIDDTLIAYINRASESIDFTIYNFNNDNISNISTALNEAHKRGVKVRIISCGTTNNLAIQDLDPNVPLLVAPDATERDGIMHNKFLVFDAHSSDPNVPLVWTGATNFTDGQINTDPNNVIIVQDQSLALAYELEFIEMWGSENEVPSKENALFGAFKKDNTPHEFIIGGKKVECYFSPSDGTNQKIIDAINTADHDLSIATMLITRSDLAYSIRDAKESGVAVNIITNNAGGNTDLVNETLIEALGVQHFVYNEYQPGIMHHKYVVIDQDLITSDPTLITGSHNWSASANDRNDENTLIIHDATIANIYYQNFAQLFIDNHGSFTEITNAPVAVNDIVTVAKNSTITIDVLANDVITSPVDVSIETAATKGNAYIPFTNNNVIAYQAQNDFVGIDSIKYRISYQTDASLYAIGTILITVGANGISSIEQTPLVKIYPNPTTDQLFVNAEFKVTSISIYDCTGKKVLSTDFSNSGQHFITTQGLKKGQYIIEITDENGNLYFDKIMKQ